MKIEDIINIKKENVEEKIENAIETTKNELPGLTTDTTCIIYSTYLSRNLYREHLANQIVSTEYFNYPYLHQFNVIPKNENELYIIDLTYKQFQNDEFNELLQKGYMVVNKEQYRKYLDLVGNVNVNKRKR